MVKTKRILSLALIIIVAAALIPSVTEAITTELSWTELLAGSAQGLFTLGILGCLMAIGCLLLSLGRFLGIRR